jgi:hypothetical protein
MAKSLPATNLRACSPLSRSCAETGTAHSSAAIATATRTDVIDITSSRIFRQKSLRSPYHNLIRDLDGKNLIAARRF